MEMESYTSLGRDKGNKCIKTELMDKWEKRHSGKKDMEEKHPGRHVLKISQVWKGNLIQA